MLQYQAAYNSPSDGHHPFADSRPTRWVLIKGLGRHGEHWHDFPQLLADVTGAQVECLDLPGTGSARHHRSPATIERIVDEMRSRWQSVGDSDRQSFLFGLSLGGMVALDWVYRYPHDFAGCVLVNTSAQTVGWPWERLRPAAMWAFLRMALAGRLADRERIVLELCTAGTPAIMDRYLAERTEIGRRSPVTVRTASAQLFAALKYHAPEATDVPLLVLAGDRDRLASPICSRRLSQRLGAELRIHLEAGHEISIDDPDWVVSEVAQWVTSNGLLNTARVMPETRGPHVGSHQSESRRDRQ